MTDEEIEKIILVIKKKKEITRALRNIIRLLYMGEYKSRDEWYERFQIENEFTKTDEVIEEERRRIVEETNQMPICPFFDKKFVDKDIVIHKVENMPFL